MQFNKMSSIMIFKTEFYISGVFSSIVYYYLIYCFLAYIFGTFRA